MIRGSTYSALLHLFILATILFGLPSLTLMLPKWQQDEKILPVVVMTESEAEKLAKRPPPSPKQSAVPKPNDTADSQKTTRPPTSQSEEKSALIGSLSTVTSADPESKTNPQETANKAPSETAPEAIRPPPDPTSDTVETETSPDKKRSATPTPPPSNARLARPENTARPESPSKDQATPARQTATPITPLKGAAPSERSVEAIIADMVEKLPRLKSLREGLLKGEKQTKFNPAIAKSAERMQKMSEEGYAHAQFSLAEMYLTGEGVQKNIKRAADLLNRAAFNGYLPAQLTLAMLAAEGRGIQKNLAEAHTWLAVAADQGTKSAAEALPKLEKRMSTKEVVEARKRSFQLRKVLVIIHGADLKKASKTELSERLRIAAALGDVESVHVLLAQGADADSPDRDGRTAIIEAAWRGYPRIVKTLVDNGASLDATDETGKNAVMWAAINGHAAVIKNLIAEGAPLNEMDKEGISALMRAAWNGHADAAQALLTAGADIRLVDKKGLRAPDYARRSNSKATMDVLARAR